MVSYEIPLGMSLLVPIMTAGALKLSTIGNLQSGGFSTWLAFANPFTFIAAGAYFLAALASCKRAPFDLPEAESELVSGYHTEYSGFRFSLFFFAEYAEMYAVSALATILFFGAWHSPLPASLAIQWWGDQTTWTIWQRGLHGVLFNGPLWLVAKSFFFLYVQIWIRWTLPRIRLDQVMYACVQVLLPLTMVVLLGNTIWELAVSPESLLGRSANMLMTLIGAVLVLGFVVIMLYGWINRRRLVGQLAIDVFPGS
jgi:NADH-quinone oxidoreductase subunit H